MLLAIHFVGSKFYKIIFKLLCATTSKCCNDCAKTLIRSSQKLNITNWSDYINFDLSIQLTTKFKGSGIIKVKIVGIKVNTYMGLCRR